jgi:hypothetical protein
VDESTFAAIAAAYGISVAELSAPPADAERAREMGRLLDIVKRLDAKGLRTLADISEQIAPKK